MRVARFFVLHFLMIRVARCFFVFFFTMTATRFFFFLFHTLPPICKNHVALQKRKKSIHLAVVRARKNQKKRSVVIIHTMRKRLVAVNANATQAGLT